MLWILFHEQKLADTGKFDTVIDLLFLTNVVLLGNGDESKATIYCGQAWGQELILQFQTSVKDRSECRFCQLKNRFTKTVTIKEPQIIPSPGRSSKKVQEELQLCYGSCYHQAT